MGSDLCALVTVAGHGEADIRHGEVISHAVTVPVPVPTATGPIDSVYSGQRSWQVERGGMPRLREAQRARRWQVERDQPAPPLIGDLAGERHALGLELGDGLLDVVAHEVQLVPLRIPGRVHGNLVRRLP